jgi:ribose transport system substrate-binding protein
MLECARIGEEGACPELVHVPFGRSDERKRCMTLRATTARNRLRLRAWGAISILGLALAISACGDDSDDVTASANGSEPLADKEVLYVTFQDSAYNAIGCGAKEEIESLGGSFEQQNAREFTAEAMTPVLNAAVARGPDGLLTSPTDPVALLAPHQAADEAGIPTVTVLNNLDNTAPLASEVIFDNAEAGREGARILAEEADGRNVKVVALGFTPGASKAADDEIVGFEEEIATHDNIEYLGAEYVGAQDIVGAATEKLNAVLAANPDLFGVFTHAGDTGEGAYVALRERGNTDVRLVANYSTTVPALVKGLRAGEVTAFVDFPLREAGKVGAEQLTGAINGEEVEKTVTIGPTVYTPESFDDPEQSQDLEPVEC